MLTTVTNLWTNEEREISLPPQEAVVTAHAQEHGDYDTQGYAEKYNKLVFVATVTVMCGNWSAFLSQYETPESRLRKIQAAADRLGERGTISGGTED